MTSFTRHCHLKLELSHAIIYEALPPEAGAQACHNLRGTVHKVCQACMSPEAGAQACHHLRGTVHKVCQVCMPPEAGVQACRHFRAPSLYPASFTSTRPSELMKVLKFDNFGFSIERAIISSRCCYWTPSLTLWTRI